ncbi:MAG TPA: DnaJ domain-containing protein [bacterium]|nr:DnaJ domain-containing protein [bacterium]HOL46707.1 DnaJ domain-containing protein [bacterium]
MLEKSKRETLYQILETDKNADDETIKENFVKKILALFPKDGIFSKENLRTFHKCIISYEILIDEKLREAYNNYLENKKNGNLEKLKERLKEAQIKAKSISKMKYVQFIRFLQNEYKLITPIRANTLIGLLYEDIERELDEVENIDPEDKVEMPIYKEVFMEFSKYLIIIFLFIIFTLLIVFFGGSK